MLCIIVCMLHRMQVLMDDNNRNGLLLWSMEENRSVSELMRESVTEKLKRRKKLSKVKKRNAAEMMLESARRLEKLGLGGPPDLSTNDDYIYG